MTYARYLALCAALAWAPAAFAQSATERIVDDLAGQGYSKITVTRTLLGRTRIVAERRDAEREIILNDRTGEILRDYWESEDHGRRQGKDDSVIRRDRSGSSGSSGSSSKGEEDDHADEDHSDDDSHDDGDDSDDSSDDNSGHGSGDSGDDGDDD